MYSISLCDMHRTSKLQVYLGVPRLNLPALGDPEFVPTQTSQKWVRGGWRRGLRVGGRGLRSNDRTLQPDSLHLAQCNFVLCPVVELGCSRRLMPGHLLGVLNP